MTFTDAEAVETEVLGPLRLPDDGLESLRGGEPDPGDRVGGIVDQRERAEFHRNDPFDKVRADGPVTRTGASSPAVTATGS